MSYITREVKEVSVLAKVFNLITEEVEEVSMAFYNDETEKQIIKAFENCEYKVLKIVDTKERTYIGRMTKEYFALNCEYYKDER